MLDFKKKVAIARMYICKELQIFFKALELIAWLSHSNLAESVIFWVDTFDEAL